MVSILSMKSILSTTLPAPLSALRTERPFQFYKTAQNAPAPPCPLSDVRKTGRREIGLFLCDYSGFCGGSPHTRTRAF